MSEGELATVAVGEQPEVDGLLVCLECGRWYRGLGGHVVAMHDVTADEYRERHELPRGRGLWAEDARRGAGARAAQRADAYPKALRTRLSGDSAQVAKGVAARRESSRRAGTRMLLRENYDRMGAATRERSRQKYEGMARSAGYDGIDDLIEKLKGESATALAEILGISVSGAKWVRRLHASGFNLDHRPAAPPAMRAEELARLGKGVQPLSDTHVMCRICGQWLKGLGRHVGVRHAMDLDTYRETFDIAPAVSLVPAAVGLANQRAQAERRDRKARELGFADHVDLIEQTRQRPVQGVARMLGVHEVTVKKWRNALPRIV